MRHDYCLYVGKERANCMIVFSLCIPNIASNASQSLSAEAEGLSACAET